MQDDLLILLHSARIVQHDTCAFSKSCRPTLWPLLREGSLELSRKVSSSFESGFVLGKHSDDDSSLLSLCPFCCVCAAMMERCRPGKRRARILGGCGC